MRSLVQPAVMKSAGVAALLSAVACFPRFVLWRARVLPIWYLELTVVLAGFVLWSFVFAWHETYSGRNPLRPVKSLAFWALASVCAWVAAALNLWLLDPYLRTVAPDDFPADLANWTAMTLFSLSFTQVFVVFAPMALFLRLVSRRWLAVVLTLAFGLFVMSLKVKASPTPPTAAMLVELVLVRVLSGAVLLFFYLRGGVSLAWWMSLIVQARHFITLYG